MALIPVAQGWTNREIDDYLHICVEAQAETAQARIPWWLPGRLLSAGAEAPRGAR